MNNKWIPAGLVLVVLIAFFFYNKHHQAPAIDLKSLPLFTLAEEPFDFETLYGGKVIVTFGASWCGSCVQELKDIKSVVNNLPDVQVVVISDEATGKIARFRDRYDLPFTFLKLNRSHNSIGIHSIPTTYFINSKGEVKKQSVGFIDWHDPSTQAHLKKIME
jgi:peroxiredoxin